MLRVFIGFDPREAAAYHVCQQSIIEHSADPLQLSFTPVTGPLRDGSNAFTYARFEVPYRCGFQGYAIFLDGDMLVRTDIASLVDRSLMYQGAAVVKHDYKTKHPTKYLGARNEDYPRKNWSSVVVWNCGFYPNRALTPSYISSKPGSFLHRFAWLEDKQIGSLDPAWNRLVMEEPITEDDKLRHFTIGSPCFPDYADCDGAKEWHETYARTIKPLEFR